METIIIYGASTSAYNIFYLLKSFNIAPLCFVVTEKYEQQNEIEGIPIYQADICLPKYLEALVLMAVLYQDYQKVEEYIRSFGIKKYLQAGLDSDVDLQLRKAYFRKCYKEKFLELNKLRWDSFKNIKYDKIFKVFMVKNHKDKKVKILSDKQEEWIIPIQAGASNTQLSLAQIKDNEGEDNISEQNCNYCELSAAYWIWKNITYDYIGLCHYRRKFILSKTMIQTFIEGSYDIIVPYPGFYAPDTKSAYLKVKPDNIYFLSDWEYMMEAIEILYPEYMKSAIKFEEGHYFIHYNMLIAKREIYYIWCEFLFSILKYIEKKYQKEERKDRYLGYLGEALTSIFIFYHQEYNIVYADISFIGEDY